MPPELLNTLAGGGLAVVGGLLGAWWTTRHAARERQRTACREMLRLTSRMWEALSTEATRYRELEEAEDRDDDDLTNIARSRDESAQAEVDHLTGELAILALDLRGRSARQAVKVCVEALQERRYLGPPLTKNGRRATRVIEQTVKASLDRRAWWRPVRRTHEIRNALNDLADEVSEAVYLREELHRAYEEWARQQRERREPGALGGKVTERDK